MVDVNDSVVFFDYAQFVGLGLFGSKHATSKVFGGMGWRLMSGDIAEEIRLACAAERLSG